MRFLATDEAIVKLNSYGCTEKEIVNEVKQRLKVNESGLFEDMVLDWKQRDLVVLPVGKETALIIEYGTELEGSYEDLPMIKYSDGKWIKK